MTLIPSAHDIEAFDRALSEGADSVVAGDAFADELRVVNSLSALDVRPDSAFTADLRAALVGSSTAAPVIALAASQRRPRRRWSVAVPVAAVVLATAGVAAAMTGIVVSNNPSAPAAGTALHTPAVSTLTTATARLDQVNALLAAGETNAADLTTLRADALALQQALLMEYGAHGDPHAIRTLHEFATSALARLSELSDRVPVRLRSLYVSTLQTLLDIAATAEAVCPACGLPPVTVPASVAPDLQPASIGPIPTAAIAPVPPVTSVPKPTTPALPTLPAGTQPTTPVTPAPTSPSKPTVPAIPVPSVPTVPVNLPTSLF